MANASTVLRNGGPMRSASKIRQASSHLIVLTFLIMAPACHGQVLSTRQNVSASMTCFHPISLHQTAFSPGLHCLQIWQYHKHGEDIAGKYSLGVFSGNATAVDDIHYDGPTGFSTAFVREVRDWRERLIC